MPLTRDTRPEAAPETLAEVAAEAPGPTPSDADSEHAAHHPTLIDPFVPSSSLEPAHTTTGGTQISTIHPDLRRSPELRGVEEREPLHGESTSAPRSNTQTVHAGTGLRAADERFRAIEHRLAQLDARMRLLEKGAERSSPGQRASLLWWTLVLVLVALWAWLNR